MLVCYAHVGSTGVGDVVGGRDQDCSLARLQLDECQVSLPLALFLLGSQIGREQPSAGAGGRGRPRVNGFHQEEKCAAAVRDGEAVVGVVCQERTMQKIEGGHRNRIFSVVAVVDVMLVNAST